MAPSTPPPPTEPACLVWTASGPATMVLPAGTRVVTPTAGPLLPWLAGWVGFIGRPPAPLASGRRRGRALR